MITLAPVDIARLVLIGFQLGCLFCALLFAWITRGR
jgi:hypothetical protein